MRTIGQCRRRIRSTALGVLSHFPKLRLFIRHAYWKYEAGAYAKNANNISVDKRHVLFESFGGRSFSCSPRSIYLAMLNDSRFADYTFTWVFKGAARTRQARMEPVFSRATVVQRGSDEYFSAMASAGTLILNTRLPEYISPKSDQRFVQCWHGTPLKRLGYDVQIETTNALNTTAELAERFGLDAKKWSYLLSPSRYTSECLASAFGLPESRRNSVIIESGYPRNDNIVHARDDKTGVRCRMLREKFGIPEGKKVLLYAPTWRDDSYQAGVGYTFDYLIDFAALKHELGDDWVVLFRPHYYIANHFDFSLYRGFVINAAHVDDINELYTVADILITDYSSVMFDYALLHRPMMLYAPDFENYADNIRGFYFNINEVPGPICRTQDALVQAILDLDGYWSRYHEAYSRWQHKFCVLDDGNASKRVVDAIFAN